MDIESLQKVVTAVSESRGLDSALQLIVHRLAAQPDIALARAVQVGVPTVDLRGGGFACEPGLEDQVFGMVSKPVGHGDVKRNARHGVAYFEDGRMAMAALIFMVPAAVYLAMERD